MANASDILNEVRYELADPEGDEFTDESLLAPLNNALRYISSMSRSIVHEISTAVQQGVYQYVLPDRYLGVRAGKIRSPRIGNRFLPLTQAALGGNDVLASNYQDIPRYYADGGRGQIFRTLATPVVESVGNVILIESAGIQGLQNEDQILNLSDKLSRSRVRLILPHDDPRFNRLAHTGFVGGARNNVEVGDALRFLAPHLAQHTILISPAPSWSDDVGEESLRLMVALRHYEVTAEHIAEERDVLEIDAELLEALKYRVCAYASNSESGLAGGRDFMLLSKTEYYENIDLVRRRVETAVSLWESQRVWRIRAAISGGGGRPNNDFSDANIN